MKRFGLALGLMGVLLLVLAGWINRPVENASQRALQPTPSQVLADHRDL